MDENKMQQEEARSARAMIAVSKGPKRLSFQIGRRGTTTLLIRNRFGVYSLRRRRYVRKTRLLRFHSIKAEAGLVARQYASLKKAGMLSWPEYDERVALWRGRLADAYWGGAPAGYRERAAECLRAARRDWRWRRFVRFPIDAAMLAGLCLLVAKAAWSALMPPRTLLLYIVVCVCVLYIPAKHRWRELFDEPDVIVQMLEIDY